MRGKGRIGGKARSDVSSRNDTPPPASSSKSGESNVSKTATFFLCVAAIYASYISQGLLQENISTKKYGKDEQRFQYLAFLNLMQCAVCFLWSFAMLRIWPGQHQSNPPPLKAYCAPSVSNTIGPACGILALRYISYPAQVLAKSSKMVPVMVMGGIVYGVHYTLQEYLCTFLVAGGVSVFALNKSSSSSSRVAIPNASLGYSLCLINLACDGFTNASQDSLTARYPGVNAWHIMMGMNFWGTLYMSLFLFLVPGAGGYPALSFCVSNPDVSWDIFWFCICGAVGQNFIFLTISHFGALTNTTVTTTPKWGFTNSSWGSGALKGFSKIQLCTSR
ncbi:unnamed protein product [Sphagnum jensenii]|uniref:UDP-galactose transporter n=1 Tax=Sphagnum jensenii TaxID=128206 RepID=A0ABP1AEU4_9BRYO